MQKGRISISLAVLTLAVSLIGGALGGGAMIKMLYKNTPVSSDGSANRSPASEKRVYVEESQIIDVVRAVSPGVVSIVISKDLPLYRQRVFNFDDFFGNDPFSGFGSPFSVPELDRDSDGNVKKERRKVGGGSGFIVSADGLVVTNRHVVEDAEADYTVIFNDQTEAPAIVLSRDTVNDIAILQLKPEDGKRIEGLSPLTLGDSSALQVGQRVIAIGNALAEYENTVTTGVVSATGRSIQAGEINSAENLLNLIQTDAAINPGNSGGPLVSLAGEVIGINTAIAARAQGIGFAIPINDVSSIIQSVKDHGKIIRPFLGVRFMMLNEAKAKELKIDVKNGALLVGDESKGEFAVVPGGPADKAGLKIRDVILEADGEPLTIENPLHLLVAKKSPGDTLRLKVWRGGQEITANVTLGESD